MLDMVHDGNDLLDGFDAADIAAILAAQARDEAAAGEARAARIRQRKTLRRVTAERHLASILPARIEEGDSWHVISHGDVDALSYLAHAIAAMPFDVVAISTWCMARDDLERLRAWLDAGQIDRLALYVGEIFPSQYGDEYELAQQLAADYDVRLVVARNHSKVILAANVAAAYYLAIEGSANVNTNPRIEQTAMHASRDLYEFYLRFFDGLTSIDRATRAPGAARARPGSEPAGDQ